jgi:uncharacterized surface protein with fasciclin (FAS1) repeats
VSFTLAIMLVAGSTAPALAALPTQQDDQTIVDIAVADGRFTTLVTALQAAGLDETLSGEGPFTVFAPTDEAFAALPDGTVDSLLQDIPALQAVLAYHVVPGEVLAADVVSMPTVDTVLGEPLTITADGSMVKVNDAQVILTDVKASNGVIHVIDSVLLPPPPGEPTAEQMPSSEATPAEEALAPEGVDQEAAAEQVQQAPAAEGDGQEAATAQMSEGSSNGYYGYTPYYGYNRYAPRYGTPAWRFANRFSRGYYGYSYYGYNYNRYYHGYYGPKAWPYYNRGYYGYNRYSHPGYGYGYRY